MSGRRSSNRIRGPQSALTDFLAANNISAAQIRSDYDRRRREADQQENAGEGPSHQPPQQDEDEDVAAAIQAEEEAELARKKKRQRSQSDAVEKIKNAKAAKKNKKAKKRITSDDDSDDDYDDALAKEMYRKSRPMPGQFAHCEICNKRFTVTPYNKEGPDGGLLCTPCGKELMKDLKGEKKAATNPVGRKRRKAESNRLDGITNGGAKSLQQMCIEKIAKHHDDLDELGDMPQPVLERLSEIFSKQRVLKSKTLPLFLRADVEDVVVHDAAYLEPADYHHMFAVARNIKRLVLGNACQMKDDAMEYMLERCHNLRHIHLYAANLVTNAMWDRLFNETGARLEVIKLKWLDAAFDNFELQEMARCCPNINRVKLKLCRRIGDEGIAALAQLAKLEHLSLQTNEPVSNKTLNTLISEHGHALRTLSLEKFVDADDTILQAIHDNCNRLSKLRFSENDTVTDAGYTSLFTDWRNPPLRFADFNSTRDVDNSNPDGPEAAIGLASSGFQALMTHSGRHLKHLDIASCRHINLPAFMDVFNGARTYPQLEYINISFCNKIDTTVVAGIFKSCPALKRLVAFGCFDVQDVVVPRTIALIGVPRAQDAIEQFGVGIGVDEAIDRMVVDVAA